MMRVYEKVFCMSIKYRPKCGVKCRQLRKGLIIHSDRGSQYVTKAETKIIIFDYIEIFCNREMRHFQLNYDLPLLFEQNYVNSYLKKCPFFLWRIK